MHFSLSGLVLPQGNKLLPPLVATYSNSDSVNNDNLYAIDIRIYDLEKDIKNLTLQIEELIFMMDDLNNKIDKVKPSKSLDNDLPIFD